MMDSDVFMDFFVDCISVIIQKRILSQEPTPKMTYVFLSAFVVTDGIKPVIYRGPPQNLATPELREKYIYKPQREVNRRRKKKNNVFRDSTIEEDSPDASEGFDEPDLCASGLNYGPIGRPTRNLSNGRYMGNLSNGRSTDYLPNGPSTGNLTNGRPTGDLTNGRPTGNLTNGRPAENLTNGRLMGNLRTDGHRNESIADHCYNEQVKGTERTDSILEGTVERIKSLWKTDNSEHWSPLRENRQETYVFGVPVSVAKEKESTGQTYFSLYEPSVSYSIFDSGIVNDYSLPEDKTQKEIDDPYLKSIDEIHKSDPLLAYFTPDEEGDTQLMLLIIHMQVEVSLQAIRQVAEQRRHLLDMQNELCQTVLHLAVITRQLDVTIALIKAGADISIGDRNGDNIIHYVCHQGLQEYLAAIYDTVCPLEAGSSDAISPLSSVVEKTNYDGRTPLHMAAQGGHLEMVIYLCDVIKVDPNIIETRGGYTILHQGVAQADIPLVMYLVTRPDVDINKKTFTKKAPLLMAHEMKHNIIKRLIFSGNPAPVYVRKDEDVDSSDSEDEGFSDNT